MAYSSLHPYKFSLDNDLYYSFITKDGIIYHAYFLSVSALYPELPNTYTFNIEPEVSYKQARHPIDSRIAQTVVAILQSFFDNNVNSMLMVCDNIDGKEEKRKHLFSRWFDNYKNDNIIKLDASREGKKEGFAYNLYVSLFINLANPDKDQIIAAFNELVRTDLYQLAF